MHQGFVYNIHIMKKHRVNYNVTGSQRKVLKLAAEKQELSASEFLRRILDDWIKANAQDIQVQVISERETE